jgi:hypothetical protein
MNRDAVAAGDPIVELFVDEVKIEANAPHSGVLELLNPLSQIRLDDLHSDRGHIVPKAALFREHGFALDQQLGAMIPENAVHNLVVLGEGQAERGAVAVSITATGWSWRGL